MRRACASNDGQTLCHGYQQHAPVALVVLLLLLLEFDSWWRRELGIEQHRHPIVAAMQRSLHQAGHPGVGMRQVVGVHSEPQMLVVAGRQVCRERY